MVMEKVKLTTTARHTRFVALRDKIEAGEFVLGTGCSTANPVSVEILGYNGFDFVICDTEVLMVNPETLENMIRAAEASGTVPVVKLKRNDPQFIQDALNAGAPIVKVPHVKSAADLERAMDAAYFKPRGSRGLCPVARANLYAQGRMADLISWTNDNVMVIPIIEDREAIENIDEIMAVEGVSVYDVGPADLANSYGVQPDLGFSNPEIEDALIRVLDAAERHGKKVMTTPLFGPDTSDEMIAKKLFERGISLMFYRSDATLVRDGIERAMQLRELAR
jgi:2-keto-3-deoxy-L-rhamnonate aldolase RhmA